MNIKQISYVLDSCLLASDGYSKENIISYGFSEVYADEGIKIYNYLKDLEVNDHGIQYR